MNKIQKATITVVTLYGPNITVLKYILEILKEIQGEFVKSYNIIGRY